MDLAEIRRLYARQMLALANAAGDSALEHAFSAVAREDFLPPGPRRIMTPWAPYVTVPENDPALIYQDVVVALDEAHGVNNGSPSLHAHWMHLAAPRTGDTVAHIGCGAGYYTAILAELVGKTGKVFAVEHNVGRSRSAARNLENRSNVRVETGDGREWPREPVDVLYVNFATPRPADRWLDNLKIGGRLLLPLGVPRDAAGVSGGLNAVALLLRRLDCGYAATALRPVSFVFAEGVEIDPHEERLAQSLANGGWQAVKSLVRGEQLDRTRCWFTGSDWGLSFEEPRN